MILQYLEGFVKGANWIQISVSSQKSL